MDKAVQLHLKYELTTDPADDDAIDRVLAGCDSTEMVVLTRARINGRRYTHPDSRPKSGHPIALRQQRQRAHQLG